MAAIGFFSFRRRRRPLRRLTFLAVGAWFSAGEVRIVDDEADLRLLTGAAAPLVVASSPPALAGRLVFPLHLGVTESNRSSEDVSLRGTGRFRSLRPKNSHGVPLGNYDNVQYHMELSIGHPCAGKGQQVFRVVPDTGSSDLWITASNCTQCTSNTQRYDMATSCSAEGIGERIHFKYGDGTVAEGVSLKDSVFLGDLEVAGQFMIQVDSMKSSTHMKSDGILGLAHYYKEDKSRTKGHTFIGTLFKQHPTLPQQFSIYLTGESERHSEIVFGDADLAAHAKDDAFRFGKAHYMSRTDLWLTSVYSVGWSGTGVEVAFPERGTLGAAALVDSGSSLIVLAPKIYDELMEELKKTYLGNCRNLEEQSILMCDCPHERFTHEMPSLVINMIDDQDQQFSLCMAPDEYILESDDPFSGTNTCVPALQRGSDRQPVPIILGMTFMRSFYTNFDVEHNRIGFARSNVSPLGAGAVCEVYTQPMLRRGIWWVSVVMAAFSVIFSIYVFFVPKDPCAGPSMRETADNYATAEGTLDRNPAQPVAGTA